MNSVELTSTAAVEALHAELHLCGRNRFRVDFGFQCLLERDSHSSTKTSDELVDCAASRTFLGDALQSSEDDFRRVMD